MAKTQWVKFTKSGTGVGLGYFGGAVAELADEQAKSAMKAGVCLPAEAEEIEAAKKAIAAEAAAKEAATKKEAAKAPVDPVAFFELLQKQSEQITTLTAKISELEKGVKK